MGLQEAVQAIRNALGDEGRITALTGAGISAESGIATFRERGGVWEQHKIEDVATPEAFARNPALVLEFYNARRRQLGDVQPNSAHRALATLESSLQERFTLITQNVDDLHERAGSRRVLHMHGELVKVRCTDCQEVFPRSGDLGLSHRCEGCGGSLRPHIVWFGEIPFYLGEEIPRSLEADVFVAIGTSGVVYPAAGMVHEARLRGKLTVEVNLEQSDNSGAFHHHVTGKAGEVLPKLVEGVLAQG